MRSDGVAHGMFLSFKSQKLSWFLYIKITNNRAGYNISKKYGVLNKWINIGYLINKY